MGAGFVKHMYIIVLHGWAIELILDHTRIVVLKLYIDYVKDGALQVVAYQIPPQFFKLRLYISTIFMHVSGTCDVRSTIIYIL